MNIAFDINNNFTFDICDWKSIVSGEPVQIKKKNKVAVTAKLQGSWLVICNILPNWSDEQGSLTRRMALLRFTKPVPQDKTDTNLLNRIINEELPLLLVKCNRAYREKLIQVGDEDVRKHWSYYFDKSIQEIDNECNAFEAFLKSDQVVIPSKTEDEHRYKNTYVLDSELKREFSIFCRRQKFGFIPWNSEEIEPKLSNGRDILRFESVKLPNKKSEENVTIDWDEFEKKSQAPNAERLVYWRGIDVVRLLSKADAVFYRQRGQENNQSIPQPTEQAPVQSLIE
uniref:D5-like primase n=1 Tax=Clandestinovirus TaxID=2831644 RepID=A0A8F8KT43_9VIRU|nr:D5-like primase [Clandestinovirus]